MKRSKKNLRLFHRTVIFIVSIFLFTISFAKISMCQSTHFISYSSPTFSLYMEDGKHFGFEEYSFTLKIELTRVNNLQNISFKLELTSENEFLESYMVEKKFAYNTRERAIYDNNNEFGVIPIFIEDNLHTNQKVTLANFNDNNLIGTFHTSNGKEP